MAIKLWWYFKYS